MATLLDFASYDAIRAAIDISLNRDSLPDDVIALPIYLSAADLEVKRRDPLWASRTGDSLISLTNAAIYLTAARIAPAMPRLLSQKIAAGGDDFTLQFQAIDWAARAQALRQQGEDALDSLIDPGDVISTRPTRFTVASGRRGRW